MYRAIFMIEHSQANGCARRGGAAAQSGGGAGGKCNLDPNAYWPVDTDDRRVEHRQTSGKEYELFLPCRSRTGSSRWSRIRSPSSQTSPAGGRQKETVNVRTARCARTTAALKNKHAHIPKLLMSFTHHCAKG